MHNIEFYLLSLEIIHASASCLVYESIMSIISCHPVYLDNMYVNYFIPTYFRKTSYSFVMSSCLGTHHIFELCYAMLSSLDRHHICEIMLCYSVCLDNINVNYFMPCFLPYYPLHLSILQCLYIQLLFLFISHFNWRE